MKTIVIFFLCMILSSITFGQIEEEKLMHVDVDEVKVVPPKFTGVKNVIPMMKEGKFEYLKAYMSKNIQYPEKDAKYFSQGTEVIQFVVSPTGELSDFTVINGISPEINEEVIRVLKTTSGMWAPGYNNNEPVAMEKEISVVFKITGLPYPLDFKTKATKYFSKGTEILFTKHNPKRALKFYDKGIMLLPNDEGLLLMRGVARHEAGDKDGAYRDWNRINALGGSFSYEHLAKLNEFKGYAELTRILNE